MAGLEPPVWVHRRCGHLLANALVTAPRQALVGLAILGAGLPVYYVFFRGKRVVDWE